jgi:hypothetical protein
LQTMVVLYIQVMLPLLLQQLPCSCRNQNRGGCDDGLNNPPHTSCSSDPDTVAYMKNTASGRGR